MTTHALFFDWDGTLWLSDGVSDENLAALNAAKKAGHKLFLNTGRAYASIPTAARCVIEWDGVIAGASYVRLGDKILSADSAPRESLRAAYRMHTEQGIRVLVEGVTATYWLGRGSNYENVEDKFEAWLDDPTKLTDVTKFTIDRGESELPPEGVFIPGYQTLVHPGYTEFFRDGFDKSTGIRLISEALGIPRENTVSFGDSLNDIDMLRYTGKSVIMASAPAFLDEVATLRVARDETGIAEGITALGLN